MEPKVYAVSIKSTRGTVLHMGVHFSLEEAYSAARKRMELLTPHKPGEAMDIDLWNCFSVRDVIVQSFDPNRLVPDPRNVPLDPPNPMQGLGPVFIPDEGMPDLLKAILGVGDIELVDAPISVNMPASGAIHSVQDFVDEVKASKNDLLNKLIETGDTSQVDKLGKFLTANEKKLVLKKIAERAPERESVEPQEGDKS